MVKRLPQPPQTAALFASDLLAGLEQAPLNLETAVDRFPPQATC